MEKQITEIESIREALASATNDKLSLVTKKELYNFLWHIWDRLGEVAIDLNEIREEMQESK